MKQAVLDRLIGCVFSTALGYFWVLGVVFAQGWLKLMAVLVPFYAWYLVVEHYAL